MPRSLVLTLGSCLLVGSFFRADGTESLQSVDSSKRAAATALLRQIDDGFAALFDQLAPAVVVIEARKRAESLDEDIQSFDFFFKDAEEPTSRGLGSGGNGSSGGNGGSGTTGSSGNSGSPSGTGLAGSSGANPGAPSASAPSSTAPNSGAGAVSKLDGAKGTNEKLPVTEPRLAERLMRMPQAPIRSEGSGFLIRSDGYILTNQHVIAEADKLDVRLKDGRILSAKVIGTDEKTDIAVIKIEAKELPFAQLGDSDKLRIGQLVAAIGAPYNQDYSFTCGWVSGKGRTNLLGPSSNTVLYEDYIQTDAFINPGNSGGPLFDVEGKVIGMNTLINGVGRGLAFAIPSNMLADVSAQLIAGGRVQRPWLGIRIESLRENAELRERVKLDRGIVVRTIEANAPAYRSELRPADIILELDGVKLSSAHDLQKEVLKKKVGESVQLTVWRAGNTFKIAVLTGEIPGEITRVAQVKRGAEPKLDHWGLKLRDHARSGVLVVEVAPESPAAKAGIQVEDVINVVEGKPVSDVAEFIAALTQVEAKEKKALLVNIERKGKRTFAMLEKQR